MHDAFAGAARPRLRAGLVVCALILLALPACWPRDFRFEATATYRAPRNGLIVEGEARGLVLAGHDTSSGYRGRFRLRPEDGSTSGVEIALSSERPDTCVVVGRGERQPWRGSSAARSLGQALETAGLAVPAPDELDAIARVMDGLVAGPKGVILEGQTDVLEVIEVHLDYPIR